MNLRQILPSLLMKKKAEDLNEGRLLIVYKDGSSVRAETENGQNTYVWRNEEWHPMKSRMETSK